MDLRLYRASRFALICALAITLSSCSGPRFEDLMHVHRIERAPQNNGFVILYPAGRFVRQAVIQADMSLPFAPTNKGWYTVMLALEVFPRLAQPYTVRSDVAHVEVGIIRWPNFGPTVYTVIQEEHGRANFRYMRDVPLTGDGGHATIRLTRDRITIDFNGRTLLSAPRRELFPKGAASNVQAGSHVYQPGDRVAGVIRNLLVQSDDTTNLDPVATPCMYEDPDLHMTRSGNDYTAEGVFSTGVGFSMYVETFGRCS